MGTVIPFPSPLERWARGDRAALRVTVDAQLITVASQAILALDIGSGLEPWTNRGLAAMPAFYGHDVVHDPALRVVRGDDLMLVTPDGEELVSIDGANVPAEWTKAAQNFRGVAVIVGTTLGFTPHESRKDVCDRLDVAARRGQLCGGLVRYGEDMTSTGIGTSLPLALMSKRIPSGGGELGAPAGANPTA